MRIVTLGRRHSVFAIDDVGWPTCLLTDAALVTAALVESLIHHDETIGAELLDQFVELPTLLMRDLPGNVEQLIKRVWVTRVQLRQMMFD